MSQADDRRFAVFLALSLALHALWLALPLRTKATGEAASPTPLNVQLAPLRAEKSVVVTRHLPGAFSTPKREPVAAAEAPVAAPAPAPATIDLDAAFATARGIGREAPSRPPIDAPRTPVTVETAIAMATRPDVPIETRGANGEYVTRSRKMRCVTPIHVPHFLEGKTMLTQCEALKG